MALQPYAALRRDVSVATISVQIRRTVKLAFVKFTARRRYQYEETTYIVFGGIPSLLHIHDINVKHRTELHLDRPNMTCTKKYYKEYKGKLPIKTILGIKSP